MNLFDANNLELLQLIADWEPKLTKIPDNVLNHKRNSQNRTIKQIVGHMVDSASNNTHRIIHLQYQPNPLIFPDYASLGNNDRWIAIQNYQNENWHDLVQLWKSANKHFVHVTKNVNSDKLNNEWISALGERVSLKAMIDDYLPHFKLHIGEIEQLM